MRRNYFARKTECVNGHVHASKREAARCHDLNALQALGQISHLEIEPTFVFEVAGKPLRMMNGALARYRPDFFYIEDGRQVVEDVKARNGFIERDVPLRWALFRACYPEIELRVVK